MSKKRNREGGISDVSDNQYVTCMMMIVSCDNDSYKDGDELHHSHSHLNDLHLHMVGLW